MPPIRAGRGADVGLTTWTSPNGQKFTMHRDAVPMAEPFFKRLHELHPQYQSLGGHAVRPMRTLDGRTLGGLSSHATGYTLDVRAPDNVLRQLAQEFPQVRWGGSFKSHYDPGHFEVKPGAAPIGVSTPAAGGLSAALSSPSSTPSPEQPMAEDGWSLSRALNGSMFQSGLGGFLAAARGGDVNEGMNAGAQRAAAMQRGQMMEEEQARRKRIEAAFGAGNFAGVPPEITNIAKLLGAEQGGNLIAKSLMERMQAEQGLNSQKQLIDYRNQAEANDPLRKRQIEIMGQPDIVRQLKAAGIDPESDEGRGIIRESIKGQNPVDQAIGDMIKGALGRQPTPPPPAPSAGGVKPMSDTGADAQPRLIQAQTSQPAPVSQGQPGSMFSGMPPEQRRRIGEAMLASPKYKALGEQIMKDLDADKIGKEARNELDKKELDLSENAARLQEINRLYRPEFQTIEGKFKMNWAALRDKIGSGKVQLAPEEKATLEQYAAYRAEAFDTVNSYIKSVTGAAMTDAEAQRILRGIPNPGTGIFDGMSPTEFKAALDQTMRRVNLALARTAYARKTGQAFGAIPLTKMEQVIRERGEGLRRDMINKGMSEDEATIEAKKAVRQEFGI